ncbi:heterokaryon incompatibility protein-domain-containing protein [Hypoxylon cercidicola]|nr:heterokaryon incompatibility protein-domain-containing protein [Hypoxylon cercidicola]
MSTNRSIRIYTCDTCSNFDIHSFKRDPFWYRGYKYSAAKEAASKGCSFCSLLVDSFGDKAKKPQEDWWIHLKLIESPKHDGIENAPNRGLSVSGLRATLAPLNATTPRIFPIGLLWDNLGYESSEFHLVADSGTPAVVNRDIVGTYPGEDVRSNDYAAIISEWLRQCESHPACNQTLSGRHSIDARLTPLPTRCVEVLGDEFKLKETGSEMGSYIALSHRWTPETDLISTTTNNIALRLQETGNKWPEQVSATFRDTVMLARQLGVHYVWIDSLCIIQKGDDGDDWKKEAIQMANYYQRALLTVFATSGSREYGLFPPKASLPPRLGRLPYRNCDGIHEGFFYAYSYNLNVHEKYNSSVANSELRTRGWVLQEWILSNRLVCFTPYGMFFECQTRAPSNERGEVVGRQWTERPVKNKFVSAIPPDSNFWYGIVEFYSSLLLTKPEKDRIVALSGIAKELRESRGIELSRADSTLVYVSGLWLKDLLWGLLWEQNTASVIRARLPGFPTWSWTSLPCPVIWDTVNASKSRDQPAAQILGITTVNGKHFPIHALHQTIDLASAGLGEFDVDCHFACLHIKGKLSTVLIRESFGTDGEVKIATHVTRYLAKSFGHSWTKVCSHLRPNEICGWASFDVSEKKPRSTSDAALEICALHISTISGVRGAFGLGYLKTSHSVMNVLFIKRIEGQRYERIGVGRLFGREIHQQYRAAAAQIVELV